MCGLVCLWKIDDLALAERMTHRIAHRGGDALCVRRAEYAPAIMGHARLAIIGTEAAEQPIETNGLSLVANGEILNYEALRAALDGRTFVSDSDCETVLHEFATGAPRWIARPDGMFAFVIAAGDRVVAGRDPLGIKPLYCATRGEGLAFASELKAFDGEGFDTVRTIAPGSLFDSKDGERTWYRLPAGQHLDVSADATGEADAHDISTELRAVLEAAVAKWMVADVEVGSFLSGGLDSSVVAALAQRHLNHLGQGRRLKTFAVGAAGSPDLIAAQRVADHIGTDHHTLEISSRDLIDAIPHVIRSLESADIDLVSSALPTFFVSKLARGHVKTVLTGEGADELFAGYAYHHAYADTPLSLAGELTRSLGQMHNINLQRVDRITMGLALEARPPFLDRDLIDFAQTIPSSLKMRRTDDGQTIEKWILRKATEDLLPHDLVWRKKAQFDEGSGTVDVLQAGLAAELGVEAISREAQGAYYEKILREQFIEPEFIIANAGTWAADRVTV
ncbi:MAG: asparagine synthase (glutamine-hydrolyzing) [Pseudomonadota bacterium]